MNSETYGGARGGAIFAGAVVCLAIQLLFVLAASALGLSLIKVESGDVPSQSIAIGAAIAAVIGLVISFFIGGWVAARLAPNSSRVSGRLHGLASWALASIAVVGFAATSASSLLGNLLTPAGVGAASATGAKAFVDQIDKLDLRIVSDLKLLDGKVVTQIVTGRTARGLASEAAKEAKNTAKKTAKKAETSPEVKETVKDVRKATASVSALALVSLLAGLGGSVWGGSRGARRSVEIDRQA